MEHGANQADSTPPALLEIMARHHENLRNQLEVCTTAKQYVAHQEAQEMISSIINATHQLVTDLEKMRSQFINPPPCYPNQAFSGRPREEACPRNVGTESAQGGPGNSYARGSEVNSSMRFATQQAQGGRKRTRVQAELETASHSCHPTEDRRKRKQLYRKQIEASRPDAADFDEETYVPVIEVEDISNEVEARLELKEITRRNIMGNRERKRKRDNPGSAMQASSGLQESASSRKRARF